LDLEKIKEYHKSYYVPHNVCLVVTGRLSTQALLEEVTKTVEAQAVLHQQDHGVKPDDWKRPFMDTKSAVIPTIDMDRSITAEFPSKETKFGSVRMVMIGPHPDEDVDSMVSSIKFTYSTLFSLLSAFSTSFRPCRD
jgi:Zn-dependent M16 (insulinase) family peptidase